MKKQLLFLVFFIGMLSSAFAQGTITGTVLDGDTNTPLPGANITIEGTSNGTTTNFDGNFSIISKISSGVLKISYLGFETKTKSFNLQESNSFNTGNIVLLSGNSLDEIIIKGVVDIAKDRKTPVAVSTIRSETIQQKLGSQELPEILNTTPSIYATKQGGGFGDARINIRGFDTQNSAVMINGIPINDMENGNVFWSNWAGLSDVASAVQVQRGLGSSKLAISSVGGTINIVTRSSDQREGGFASFGFGNDNYLKNILSYSTGQLENNMSASFLFSRTSGDGYADGLEFEGYNYFLALGYAINSKNSLEFTVTGAPQWHNQRSRGVAISDYIRYGNGTDPDIKYNDQWGFRNGEEFSFRQNFYHKPIINLNFDSELSSTVKLRSSIYASFARGGGTGEIGEINGLRQFVLPRTSEGLVRVDDIFRYNSGQLVPDFNKNPRAQLDGLYVNNSDRNDNSDNTNGITRRASINSHNWYGILASLDIDLSENLVLNTGIDLRNYKGFHYRRVNNLLGGDAYQLTDDRNNPITPQNGQVLDNTNLLRETYSANPDWWVLGNIDDEEKIDYYNIGYVGWAGVFGQLEYSNEIVTAFLQGSLSNQGFAREELFGVAPPEKTDVQNILGGNIKGGLNWNIDDNHNVFANVGYFSKQPLFDAVFLDFSNSINPDLVNEQIIGTEIGYGYRNSNFKANVNLYRTSWADRFQDFDTVVDILDNDENDALPEETRDADNIEGSANVLGLTQVHYGLEIDGRYQINNQIGVSGMLSIGDWQYQGDITATLLNNDQETIEFPDGRSATQTFELDGVKVGDAAQFTASLGADVAIISWLSVDATYRYTDNLYAALDPTTISNDGALKLPAFNLLDAGLSVKIPYDKSNTIDLRLNVNNVTDTVYISESDTNTFAGEDDDTYKGISQKNRVYFGFGRTWNASLRFNF